MAHTYACINEAMSDNTRMHCIHEYTVENALAFP